MGFNEAKRICIESLKKRNYRIFEERKGKSEKNKLYTGEITPELVLKIINECEERDYDYRFFSGTDDNKSHIFIKFGWYIKYCLINNKIHFISVHKEKNHG